MSTDRELLELAMKAAKVKPPAHMKGWYYSSSGPYGEGLYAASDRTDHVVWNPLRHDADALRLAVKLQLTICNEHLRAGQVYCTRSEDESFPSVNGADDAPDMVMPEDYAATRRAIVSAAAEIGKGMP